MRRTTSLPAACLVAGLTLAACGGGSGGTDGAAGGHGGHEAAEHAGEPTDPSGADRTIEVEARDIAFDPTSIEVEAGETVTFVVTNTGEAVHEFTLGDAATQEEHAEEMGHADAGEPHHGANSVTIEPGRTAELTWRFDAARELEYACHVPGHYEAGMRGTITVA